MTDCRCLSEEVGGQGTYSLDLCGKGGNFYDLFKAENFTSFLIKQDVQ